MIAATFESGYRISIRHSNPKSPTQKPKIGMRADTAIK